MRKLVFSLLLVVLAAIFGLGWGLDRIFERLGDKRNTDEITILSELGTNLAATLDKLTTPAKSLPSESAGNNIVMTMQAREDFPLPPELATELDRGEVLVLESDDGVSLHFFLPTHEQVLSMTPEYLIQQQKGFSLNLVFTIVFYSGILCLMLLWIYPLVARLLRMRSAAKRFGEGDLDERIVPGRFSYIRDIENEFNRMADKIQTLVSDNKLLANAVSHDLRTPLARLRFGIDTLAETGDPEKRDQYHNKIGQDLDEMERLVATLLSYARLDQSMETLEKKPLELVSLSKKLVQRAKVECDDLEWRANEQECWIQGDQRHLQMLINNLLQNACRYANNRVIVSLSCKENSVCRLIIEDDGKGIPEEQRDHVLKPFVRGEGEDKKGYGMGLAIVARIALWHKAILEISSSDELKGAKLQLDFNRIHQD